jgi:hypothetical protein
VWATKLWTFQRQIFNLFERKFKFGVDIWASDFYPFELHIYFFLLTMGTYFSISILLLKVHQIIRFFPPPSLDISAVSLMFLILMYVVVCIFDYCIQERINWRVGTIKLLIEVWMERLWTIISSARVRRHFSPRKWGKNDSYVSVKYSANSMHIWRSG